MRGDGKVRAQLNSGRGRSGGGVSLRTCHGEIRPDPDRHRQAGGSRQRHRLQGIIAEFSGGVS